MRSRAKIRAPPSTLTTTERCHDGWCQFQRRHHVWLLHLLILYSLSENMQCQRFAEAFTPPARRFRLPIRDHPSVPTVAMSRGRIFSGKRQTGQLHVLNDDEIVEQAKTEVKDDDTAVSTKTTKIDADHIRSDQSHGAIVGEDEHLDLPKHRKTSRKNKPIDIDAVAAEYNFWDENVSIAAFNMDLHNLAMEDADKAEDLLQVMEELHKKDPDNPLYLQPDAASYTIVIEGWCFGASSSTRRPDPASAGQNSGDDAGSPNSSNSAASVTTTVATEYDSDDGPPENADDKWYAAEKAQMLLDKMEETCSATGQLCPNELSYMYVCQKWALSYQNDYFGANAQKAHDILTRLQKDENGSKMLTVKLYSIVLEGWCRRAGYVPHAMDRAFGILEELESMEDTRLRPNVLTYTSIIGGLARKRDSNVATQAEAILHKRMPEYNVEPDMVAYTSVLNCWAKTTDRQERRQASRKALLLLEEMEHAFLKEDKYHLKPNVITYATAIKAIGNSLSNDAPALCEKVLRHMYDLTETKTIHVPPNAGAFNAVIASFSRGGPKHQKLANAKRAEHLLVEMIKKSSAGETTVEPNVRSWGGVLRAWSQSGLPDAGEQAQRVLDRLEDWYDEGRSTVRPNVVCYTTVMSAWGKGGASPHIALAKIETLLLKMEAIYDKTLDKYARPNNISYVTAIDAFCRKDKEQAASRAQATIDRMMKLYSKGLGHARPTRIVFNALIHAWSCSSDPNGAANAEKTFQWMEQQYQQGDEHVKPDEITLCGVLNAWAKHAEAGGALRAQQILDHTESLTQEERGFVYSIVCHNIVIKAWGRSRAPDSVDRAESILTRLEEQHRLDPSSTIRPDTTTYSSVINCCAYFVGNEVDRRHAFDVAIRTFGKLRQSGRGTNHITFGTLFKVISKLAPVDDMRDPLVTKYFEMCKEDGQVGSFVLHQLKTACSSELYRNLVLKPCSLTDPDSNFEAIMRKIPSKWSSKVESYY